MVLFSILETIRFHYISTNSAVISFWNKCDSNDVQTKRKKIQTLLLFKKTLNKIVIKNSYFSSERVHFHAIGSIFSAVSTIIGVKTGWIARVFQFP